MATRKVPYTDARGVRRWVEVSADCAAGLDAYDRWARRREKAFRETHTLATDVDAAREAARGRRFKNEAKLVGYLNYELEPAAKAAGLGRDEGYPWEGPRFAFSLLLGESPTWSGPESLWLWVQRDGEWQRVCRFCGHLPELPVYAACLNADCSRTGRDAEVERGQARRRDRLEETGLKGGRG